VSPRAERADGLLAGSQRPPDGGKGRGGRESRVECRELVDHIAKIADADPQIIVGFDFAFSFPSWWCEAQGWHDVREVWSAMATQGELLLSSCEDPLWGRPGKRNPHALDRRHRRTETEENKTAKSVFQIGGAGAVGTGSVRGMPYLQTLIEHGFSVWPFDAVRPPSAIEIYPRALTGTVNKSRWIARHALLHERFPMQPAAMLERAAGSEDAFDAAVSALVMAQHQDEIAALSATTDPEFAIEGRVWRPQ
jgi:hypothetical protein